jgi:hypothetical protein
MHAYKHMYKFVNSDGVRFSLDRAEKRIKLKVEMKKRSMQCRERNI